jgi:hypothetical protein
MQALATEFSGWRRKIPLLLCREEFKNGLFRFMYFQKQALKQMRTSV